MNNDKETDNHYLADAYSRMMERLTQTGEDIVPGLQQRIESVAETAVELQELTREEASLLSAWLKRDLEDAGHYLAETGHDFKRWLRLDVELVEDRLLDWLQQAADRSRLEIQEFKERINPDHDYRSGEITAPGVLQCRHCGTEKELSGVAVIADCDHCGGRVFRRCR